MDSLFQNLVPGHILEILLIIFVSALLAWLYAMYHWKQKLSNATLEWESRFNTKSRDYNELRNNYSSLDKTFKESQTKLLAMESQVQESTHLSKQLSEEKIQLSSQLKKYEVSTLEFQKTISNLEEVKNKHQETLPIIKANQQEIERHKKEAEILAKQKKDLTGVVNGLKDYRTRYEDTYLQLTKQKKELENAHSQMEELELALKREREEGPRVLELTGKLRWIQSEKEVLTGQIKEMELWMEDAAFTQLKVDAQQALSSEPVAEEVTLPSEEILQPYQVQLWEKEGELRWAEEEKLSLSKKIEELEYARQSLLEKEAEEKEAVDEVPKEEAIPVEPKGLDQNGKLTHLAIELEEVLDEKHTIGEQLTEMHTQLEGLVAEKESLSQLSQSQQDTIYELKGRIRWAQWDEGDLQQSNSELKQKLEVRFDQLEKEKEQTLRLTESLKLRENEFQELEKRMASEQVAQALIESEERDEMQSRLEDLLSSTYKAAADQWDQLAENTRLSLSLKKAEEHVGAYTSELEALKLQEAQNKEELIRLFDQVQELQESAYSAAQWTADHQAENTRLDHTLKGLRQKIDALSAVEAQKEALETELTDLRESAYLAAQEQADQEAESLRVSLRTKSLEEQLTHFQGVEAEKAILLEELDELRNTAEELRNTAYVAAKQQADDEGSLIRHALSIQQMGQQLESIQAETKKEKNLLQEEIESLHQSMEASEKDRMEHQKKVEELEEALKNAEQQLEEIHTQKNADEVLFQEITGSQTLLEEEKQQLSTQLKELRESTQMAAQHSADNLGELTRIQLDLGKARKEISSLEGEIQSGSEQIQQLQAQMIQQDKEHTREVEEMEEALKLSHSLVDQKLDPEKAEELTKKIQELEEALNRAQTEKAQKNLRIAQLESRVEDLSTKNEPEDFPAFPNDIPASVSFALELTEEEKDLIRQRIFEKRENLELNFGRIGIASGADRDDLTQIDGIDAFIEERLNLIQIYCFAQIANFSEEESTSITEVLELTPGIIDQKDWIQQAKKLRKK